MLISPDELLQNRVDAENEDCEAFENYRNKKEERETKVAFYQNQEWLSGTKAEAKVKDETDLYSQYNLAYITYYLAKKRSSIEKAKYYHHFKEMDEGRLIDVEASRMWAEETLCE